MYERSAARNLGKRSSDCEKWSLGIDIPLEV